VIVAVPLPFAVTTPAVETVATEALDVVHVTAAPEIRVPLTSFTVAVRVDVAPIDENERLVGDSVTDEAV
jgi:hypothetical protein